MTAIRRLLPGFLFSALLVSGCATTPAPLDGEFSSVTPEQSGDRNIDERVRWGGRIVDTRPGESETCIEVLSQALDSRGRPHSGDSDQGRFLACRDGFEDPAIFEGGRDLTVVGTLIGFVEGRIGEFRYVYPRVQADTLFLWGEKIPDHHYYHGPVWYYDPWWPYARFPWSRGRWNVSGHIVIGD